jgi:hypothetical protein
MPKTIILDDETYNKLKKKAADEDRSMSKMAKILFDRALSLNQGAGATPAPQQPAPQPAPQPSLYDTMWAAYSESSGTVFDESTHFATADEAIDFFARSSKPIHLAGSNKALRLRDLIEYSDEMRGLRAEAGKWAKEIEAVADAGGNPMVPTRKYSAVADKISDICEKSDNFMSEYQGLNSQ